MLISSTFLLPHLRRVMRQNSHDASRHGLCPACLTRTKLYTLADGRKKCSTCKHRFRFHRALSDKSLRIWADSIVSFVLDLPANSAAMVLHCTRQVVAKHYSIFREAISRSSLTALQCDYLSTVSPCRLNVPASTTLSKKGQKFLKKCVLLGLYISADGKIVVEPIVDVALSTHLSSDLHPCTSVQFTVDSPYSAYFCHSHLIHSPSLASTHTIDGIDRFWSWAKQKLVLHHAIPENRYGYYMEELAWKYNHRYLQAEDQATVICSLLSPKDFQTF